MRKSTSRQEVSERKKALAFELRAVSRAALGSHGDAMVSVRELSARYGLALRTVSLELQKLAAEGVLYTVPRVGTFVGRPRSERSDLFVAIFPSLCDGNTQTAAICSGFEERIAALGGASLMIDREMARQYQAGSGEVRPAGIFEFREQMPCAWLAPGAPRVEFGEISKANPDTDMVYFDNVEGGSAAARHLISLGHRRIAYLGLHAEKGETGFFLWSRQREQGWRQCMSEAGLEARGLAFHPAQTPDVAPADVEAKARQAVGKLLSREATAVVVVNAIATRALFQMLREAGRPASTWPAIVSFDSEVMRHNESAMNVVSAFRLPWEQIGREAATVLWERAQGRLSGAGQQRLVPMSLIPRLSCRQEWHRAPNAALFPKQEFVAA